MLETYHIYEMSKMGLCHPDQINQMITFSMITLSGGHCNNFSFFSGQSFKMKVLLAFVVTLALMSQHCDCLESSLHEENHYRSARAAIFGGVGAPAYLSVPGFMDCLSKKQMGTASVWCVPAAKTANCADASWQKLVSDATLGKC
jgi:hypothetical protein